jgi:hypothetical protein
MRIPYVSCEQAVMLVYLLRTVLDVPVTTYHSGIYAVRRVNRPMMVVFLIDFLGLATAFSLRPWLGGWAVPLSLLVFSVVQSGLAVVFVRRMYNFVGWEVPLPTARWVQALSPRNFFEKRIILSGLAGVVMSLDSLLIIGLSLPGRGRRDETLTVLLFLVAPLLRACHDWAIMFFPDIRRLNLELFRHLYGRFMRAIQATSWSVALFSWALALIATEVVLGRRALSLAVFLLPLFIVRSMLAFVQIRAFSTQHFIDMILGGVCFIGGAMLIPALGGSDKQKLLSFSVLYLPIIFLTALRYFRLIRDSSANAVQLPSCWFKLLRSDGEEDAICAVTLSFDSTATERHMLVRDLAKMAGSSGMVSQLGERCVLVNYSRQGLRKKIAEVLAQGAGAFENVRWFHDREECLGWVREFLARYSEQLPGAISGVGDIFSDQSAQAIFRREFPDGKIVNLIGELEASKQGDRMLAPAVLAGAVSFAKNWRHADGNISALVDGEVITTIFVIPQLGREGKAAAKRWERYIAALNFHHCTSEAKNAAESRVGGEMSTP